MDIEDINKQVEDSPLTKEEAKEQFVEMTEQLGLDHSYNFDEAWEIGQELRRRKDFRNTIVEFEETVREKGGWLSEEDTKKLNPEVRKYLEEENSYTKEIMRDTENLQKKIFKEVEGRIKLDDESLPFKDKKYEYWTKTTKEGNYSKKLRKKPQF